MSEPLWTAKQVMAATSGELLGSTEWQAGGVSIDTRTLKPGDIFVALRDTRDGHAFVPDAMARGASAALVERADAGPGNLIKVSDTLNALQALGEAARRRSSAVRVAVTGSVGKTSVKEAIAAVFRAAGPAHWSVASYNNHWGVPLTLARMPRATERGVFEMGMNHAGEIRELSTMVRPHVALITRIAPAHLENLGTIEAIADAKGEIFEGLETDGVAIYPADDAHAERLARHAKHSSAAFMLEFGTKAGSAIRIESFDTDAQGSRGMIDVLGVRVPFRLAASGDHWAWNTGAIFAAAAAAGLDARHVSEALSAVDAERGRGQALDVEMPDGGRFTLLDDAYNANPVSMRAAISALGAVEPGPGGRRIAIMGDMLELGETSPQLHAELTGPLEEARTDLVFCCGALMRNLQDALPAAMRAGYAHTASDLLELVKTAIQPGDVVLIKGSHGSGLHKIASVLADGSAFTLTEA